MALGKGDKAPEFELFASDKSQVSLGDFRGRNMLLLFFPFAFSSTCSKEMCTVRDDLERYNELACEVVAVSVDSLYTLAKFKKTYKLDFTLLSDFNKEVSRAYGALYEVWVYGMRGVAKRAAFVINKAGVIRHAEVLENASLLPDFVAIDAALSRLK